MHVSPQWYLTYMVGSSESSLSKRQEASEAENGCSLRFNSFIATYSIRSCELFTSYITYAVRITSRHQPNLLELAQGQNALKKSSPPKRSISVAISVSPRRRKESKNYCACSLRRPRNQGWYPHRESADMSMYSRSAKAFPAGLLYSHTFSQVLAPLILADHYNPGVLIHPSRLPLKQFMLGAQSVAGDRAHSA